jgi:hypothetical protein
LSRPGPGWCARGGERYKPASVRGYECAPRLRAYPARGTEPLDQISRADAQELVDTLAAEGLAATTIKTTINSIRAIYRHELGRDRLKMNPTRGVTLPAGGSRRERFATPVEAKGLLAALETEDRALWATAFYAGLPHEFQRPRSLRPSSRRENVLRVGRVRFAPPLRVGVIGRNESSDRSPPNPRSRDGSSSWCRRCHAAAVQRWRERNPAKAVSNNLARRVKHDPRPCTECGDLFTPGRSNAEMCSDPCRRRRSRRQRKAAA